MNRNVNQIMNSVFDAHVTMGAVRYAYYYRYYYASSR